MKHPPSTAVIEVDLHHVLWFTRGKGWDYTFLLCPLLPRIVDPVDLCARIFEGLTIRFGPHSITGRVRDGHEQRGYLATTFFDPVRRDEANQPVAHHLVWFPPDGQTRQVAPTDWGPQLVAAMRAPYDAVSPVFMQSVFGFDPHQRIRQLFAAELAHLSPRVRVEGPAIMIYRTDVVLAVDESFATRARWWRRWPRLAAVLVWLGVALALWMIGKVLGW